MTDRVGPGPSGPGHADKPGVGDPGRGRRIAVDVGSVRIGVAASDPDGILATPVETVPRAKSRNDKSDIERLAAIVAEYDAVEVIVGLPQTLKGERGTAAGLASRFAAQLRDRLAPTPVRMTDERFTTVTASRALRESGVRAKGQRSVIDQAAAVAILQGWLDQRSAVLRTAQNQDAAHDHDPEDDE